MTASDDIKVRLRRLADIVEEMSLCSVILRFAQSGHATELMVEQAIQIVDKVLQYCDDVNDPTFAASALSLKAGLERALKDGIETLRNPRGPGPESINVESPLAEALIARGHDIRRQHRCSVGIVDIYDLTADEIIECKHIGSGSALGEAAGQLRRYARAFPGSGLAIAVVSVEAEARWLADILRREGIRIIEVGGSR